MKNDFRNQQPWTVAQDDIKVSWSGGKDGKYFRCGLCGHKFVVGDTCRWVYMNSTPTSKFGNFLVCSECDCSDVINRRLEWEKEAENKFWQLLRD